MRQRIAYLRRQWRRIPARTRMGVAIAVMAVAGLAWQHHTNVTDTTTAPAVQQHAAPTGPALTEPPTLSVTPSPSESSAPVDVSSAGARSAAERFATNFATPNGDRDGWLARLSTDVSPELLGQYQSTDIATVPQTAVSQVTGPMGADPGVATFQIDYADGSRLEATLELGEAGWKVSSVIPVEHSAPPAPAPAPDNPPSGVIPLVASTP
ncbi:hypothetical protein Mycsm_07207 (plasmid) [Mycobacterium sp. JS623]|uniref:hypothetical protein n=1 Tax=Mycobacterium sp. JS623 TaxID=212767 RepID=UPI0002A5A8F2|nr:hypothetical protein [Mycobacterium sp. JS623]AGB27301.1 hypothetical protein Mycsm_07207 [Mycobacterium sp. JS623]